MLEYHTFLKDVYPRRFACLAMAAYVCVGGTYGLRTRCLALELFGIGRVASMGPAVSRASSACLLRVATPAGFVTSPAAFLFRMCRGDECSSVGGAIFVCATAQENGTLQKCVKTCLLVDLLAPLKLACPFDIGMTFESCIYCSGGVG